MILDWRMQWGKGPEAAKMAEAEDAAGSKAGMLSSCKEPRAEQFAESASPNPQAARDQPTSLLIPPDSERGNFRVGRPLGSLKSPHQGLGHSGLTASLRS